MRRFIDDAHDDHPALDSADDEDEGKAPAVWSVLISDDCDTCADLRVVLTVEAVGVAGAGAVAHLSPANARRLRQALGLALKELGQPLEP